MKKTKTVVVGTLCTTVPAGKTLVLDMRLNTKGAALLKKHHRLRIALAGRARTGTGASARLSGTITIAKPPNPKHDH